MNIRWTTGLRGWHWGTVACLGSLGWMGMSLPALPPATLAQSPQSCVDEISHHLRGAVIERAQQGREALRQGNIQLAVAHLAESLDFLGTIKDAGVSARMLDNFVQTNSADSGWLVHEVDRFIELGETEAARIVLTSAQAATQDLPNGHSSLKARLLVTMTAAYGAIGDRQTALDLLSQARQVETSIQGAEFKAKALTEIAQGYSGIGENMLATEVATLALQQAEAVAYLNPVRRAQRMAPIAIIYAEAGEIDPSLQVAQSIEEPYYRDLAVGSAALAAAQFGQLDRATDLVQSLTVADPKQQTLIMIGLQLANDGDSQQAQQYFDQAIAVVKTEGHLGLGLSQALMQADFIDTALAAVSALPEGRFKINELTGIASHYAKARNLEAARAVLSQAITATTAIEENYARDELLQEMIDRAIEIEAYDIALSTIDVIKQLPNSPVTFDEMTVYESVASAAAESGQIDLALSITELIEPSYTTSRHRAWAAIAVAYAAADNFEAALAVAQKIDGRYSLEYAKTLTGIGLQQQQVGLTEASATTIAQAIQAANALETDTGSLMALNTIALAHAKAGLSEPAADLFDQVLEKVSRFPATSDNTSTLQDVAHSWIEIEEPMFALRTIRAIADEPRQSSMMQDLLVRHLIPEDQYSMALEIIDTYSAPATKAEQMLRVAELYFQAGQTTQAVSVLSRTFEVAQTIPGEESKVVHVRQDLVVDDLQDRGSLYEEIAIAYGKMKAFEQGLAVAQSLQDHQTRDQTIARLSCYRDL